MDLRAKRRTRTPAAGRVRLGLEGLEVRDVPAAVSAFDPSFGTAGRVSLPGNPLNAVALQPDGKVVVVGTSANDIFVARYNPDGTPDITFNGTGTKTLDFGGIERGGAVAIQADGKIVVAGTTTAGVGGDFAVARLNPTGTLDTTFDLDGLKLIDFNGVQDVANALAIQADGKILVVGNDQADFAVARLNPADGSLDAAFDADGKRTVNLGGMDAANAVAVQADGKIVLAGTDGANFALARLNPADGSPDLTFGGAGTRVIDLGGTDIAFAVAVQPDGKIVAAGTNGADFAVVRLNAADASLDTAFNASSATPGKLLVDVAGADVARAVAVLANGKIVLVGNSAADLAVVRLTPAGTPDLGFNGTGKATFDLGATDFGTAAVVTGGGRVVIAGQNTGATFGTLTRITGSLDEAGVLAVGGAANGKATVFVANPATGLFTTTAAATVTAFGTTTANVRVATGDVNGDGFPDTILILGPGAALQLAVVSGKDNTTLLVKPIDPLGGNFTGGGFVAAGDLDNDGRAEVVVTPDRGGGPRVAVFSLGTDGVFTQRASFFGIDDPGFRGGARVGVGDVDADGVADLVIAAGFGGGPRIAVFDGRTVFTARLKLANDFFAFADVLRNGVYVTVGDVDGDGFGDLVVGAGPGGSPRLLVVSGRKLLVGGSAAAVADPLANFFVAGNDTDRGGVRVSTADVDGDNKADVVVGSGENQATRVRVYLGKTLGPAGEPAGFQDLDPFAGVTLKDGVYVG